MPDKLLIPDWLSFDCSGCGLCCRRGWVIAVTSDDRERIMSRDWKTPESELIARYGGQFRFAVDDCGKCGFLDEKNLCRIHAEMNFDAKVLACRMYPFTLVPSQGGVRVGLHFSCPTAAKGEGRLLSSQKKALQDLAADMAAQSSAPALPENGPDFIQGKSISWKNLEAFEAELDRIMCDEELPLLRRIMWATGLVFALEQGYVPDLGVKEFSKLLSHYVTTSRESAANAGLKKAKLGRMEGVFFRTLVGLASELAVGGMLSKSFFTRQKARLQRLLMAQGFFLACGEFDLGEAKGRFSDIEKIKAWPLCAEGEELLAKFLRLRFFTRSYFGSQCWQLPVASGVRFTLSLYAVTLYLARMHAAARCGASGGEVTYDDMLASVMLTDHAYGHMTGFPVPGVSRLLTILNRPQWPILAASFASL